MHFSVFISVIIFPPKAFANPLPRDSIDSDPYLLALVDPTLAMPTLSNPFISDSRQTPSFSRTEVNPILNSQYTSTIDPSELVVSTDPEVVPCNLNQISDAFATERDRGTCSVEWPKDESEQQHKPPTGAQEPERKIPPVPNILPKLESEDICPPGSVFRQHYCCDGPIGSTTEYAGQICYYLIPFCLPSGSWLPH